VTHIVNVARNLPLTVSVVAKHFGRSGSKSVSVVLRRSPGWIRRLLVGHYVQRFRPDIAAIALAADGRLADGSMVMSHALERDSIDPVTARRVAQAAVVLHDLPLAELALQRYRSPDLRDPAKITGRIRRDRMARSVVAAEKGRLVEALTYLEGVPGARSRRLSSQIAGEAEVLRGSLLSGMVSRGAAHTSNPLTTAVRSVLHVVSSSLPEQQSGYTIRTQGIAKGQREAGLDAQVVTRLGFPVDIGAVGAATTVTVDGVDYHRMLPRGRMPIPGSARQALASRHLINLVEREQPNVIHAHSKHENAQIAIMVGRKLGLSVVYEARGFLEETWVSTGGDPQSDFYRWSRDAETLCMRHADAVVTLSSAMGQDIEARGILKEKIFVVPNAVSAGFASRPAPPGSLAETKEVVSLRTRARLGIRADSTVFGSVSTLNAYEGFDTVIQAINLLADPGVVLLLVGAGPDKARLESMARAAGVSEQVIFSGRVSHDRVREHLDAMDVFVVPRVATAVTRLVPPIKPLEAMAVGLPVLASDLAPLVEIVRPGVFGEVAGAQDVASWAEHMASLRYAPEHRQDLGMRAAEFVAQERTWACAADLYAGVYAAAVRR